MAIGLVAGMLTKGSRSSAGGAARRVMRQPTNPASAVMTPQLKRKRAPGPNLSINIVAAVGPIADPSAHQHTSDERRVGNAGVSTGSFRWWPYHSQQTQQQRLKIQKPS